MSYRPVEHWSRLHAWADLTAVGQSGLPADLNAVLYRALERRVRWFIRRHRLLAGARTAFEVGAGIGYWVRVWHDLGVERVDGCDLVPAAVDRLAATFGPRGDRFTAVDVGALIAGSSEPAEATPGPAGATSKPAEVILGPTEAIPGPAEAIAGPAETIPELAKTIAGPAETIPGPAEPAETVPPGRAGVAPGPAGTIPEPARAAIRLAPAEANPLSDRTYPFVSVMNVLLHLTDDAAFERALARIAALVEPGGHLLLVEPILLDPSYARPVRATQTSRARVLDAYRVPLLAAGLTLVDLRGAVAMANNPIEAGSRAAYDRYLRWWRWVAKCAKTSPGKLRWIGPLMLGLDRIVLATGAAPSSKIAVFHRPQP